jgi:hypothetical protein
MSAPLFATFGFEFWTTCLPLGTGVLVAALVIGSTAMYWRWHGRRGRRGLTGASREEDLPWKELLVLLKKRKQDRAAAGLPFQEPTEEELGELLATLPAVEDPEPLERPEDREFMLVGGAERRAGRRRWGNPTEVLITAPGSAGQLHGLVVNRSTGGLGILTDKELSPGALVTIRAVEAPSYVPVAWAEIRHCRKVGNAVLLGCRFSNDISWNVRVWFG